MGSILIKVKFNYGRRNVSGHCCSFTFSGLTWIDKKYTKAYRGPPNDWTPIEPGELYDPYYFFSVSFGTEFSVTSFTISYSW